MSYAPVIRYIAWWDSPGEVVRLQGHYVAADGDVSLFVATVGNTYLAQQVFETPEAAVANAQEEGRRHVVSLGLEIEAVRKLLEEWRGASDLTFRDE